MEITHLGHSSFKLRGKQATVITDPFDPAGLGIKFPTVTADIVTVSHQHPDHNYIAGVGEEPLIISGPGEYEAKGVRIFGIATYHDAVEGKERGSNVMYHIEMDGLSLLHCGDLGHVLSDKQKEGLGDIDILLIPVGGHFTLGLSDVAAVIADLEPTIIIPMHYRTDQTAESLNVLAPVTVFLKEIGKETVVPQPKLTITKDKLPAEQTVVVLE